MLRTHNRQRYEWLSCVYDRHRASVARKRVTWLCASSETSVSEMFSMVVCVMTHGGGGWKAGCAGKVCWIMAYRKISWTLMADATQSLITLQAERCCHAERLMVPVGSRRGGCLRGRGRYGMGWKPDQGVHCSRSRPSPGCDSKSRSTDPVCSSDPP